MKKMLDVNEVKSMIQAVCERVISSKDYLTEIDSKIGDGDHGIGMALGMGKVKETLIEKADFASVNEVFNVSGMTMLENMGGASGVIFGALFFGGLKGIPESDTLDGPLFTAIMRNSLEYIKKKGKAQPGDKTMVDALEPAVIAMESLETDSLADRILSAVEAADRGVEQTKQYVARFGRAKSLMARSIGFQDAGATSVSIIFHAMAEYLGGELL